jgi:putative CocE/NonD family hydrolase
VPRVTSSDIGGDWMHDGGVFCLYTMVEWAIGTWVDQRLYHADIDWSIRPLDAILPTHHAGRRSASLDRWVGMAPDDPAWTRGIYGTPDPLRRIAIPVLHSPGTYDVFRRGQLRDWAALRLGPAGGAQRLVLDATDHFDDLHPGDGDPAPDFLEEPAEFDRFLPRYLEPARRFLRAHLLGEGTDAAAPVRVRVAHRGWLEAAEWPPAGSVPRVWHLQTGGGLGAPSATASTLAWEHDPADPVPDPVADPWRPLLERVDEAPLHRRGDVHVFRSAPVERDVDLVGGGALLAVAAADADAASLVATLLDVHPDGRCERISEGARRIGREEGPAAIDFGPVAHRLRPGHALAVAVAASMFPRYLPTMAASGDPWRAEPGAPIVHRVGLGGSAGARLVLSVLD